jgi:phospholipase/lecithinase/hemolysin
MKTILAAAATFIAFSATISQASTTVLAFGDSLVDGGNAQIATVAGGGSWNTSVYPNGQFTNGNAWATQIGLLPSFAGGTNYGFGGARAVTNNDGIPDLLTQIGGFLSSGVPVAAGTAAAIWAGGNDFLALAPDASAKESVRTIKNVVKSIASGVKLLAKSGVSDILVLGLPDFGLLPGVAADPLASAKSSVVTGLYNATLDAVLTRLDRRYAANVSYFDTNSLFQQVIAGVPAPLVSVPCLAQPVDCAANPTNYVFYDTVHPTEWVHTVLASAIAGQLGLSAPSQNGQIGAVPLPATAPLIVFGLGGLALWSRRRRSPA